ncbi:MAG: alanine racemase [Patescibacteria group bacterium]
MLTEIRISRSAFIHNVKSFRNVIGPRVKLMAVVKSNAYGHGVGECAPFLARHNVDWFGVASTSEALAVHRLVHSKPILVLSYIDVSDTALVQAIRKGIRLPVYTREMLARVARVAKRAGQPVHVHLKFDTGTTRIGFLSSVLPTLIRQIRSLKYVQVEGVFSHFAEVESRQQAFTKLQIQRFTKLASTLEAAIGRPLIKHLDCSAGVLLQPDAHFDMVRVGMSLYGIHTIADLQQVHAKNPAFDLRPVLSWHTKVIQMKSVPAGTTIGYNRTYRTSRRTTIATLPVGYWDGYDRKLSQRGLVFAGQTPCPVRGRVCMNVTMVDATKVHGLRAGTTVELIGPHITATAIASMCGTIPYEVLTRLNPLIPRTFVP